jgi:nucleoside-diphosphate-sugar epimerase
MTTFITGATSSIGRVLVKRLAHEGVPVRILARVTSLRSGLELPGVEFHIGDVTDPDCVRTAMQGCDRVYHLAAVVSGNAPKKEWMRVNRGGTQNVLQAAADLGVRSVVHVSSLSVLGCTAPGELADETRRIDTALHTTLYQKSKYEGDKVARKFHKEGLNVRIVYPAFGFGCSWASSHPSMAETTLLRLAAGKPVAVVGSGRNRLTLAYYKDTVQGILLADEKGQAGRSYILGGPRLTFPEIWQVIGRVLDKKPPHRRIPLPILKFAFGAAHLVGKKNLIPSELLEMIAYDWNFSSDRAVQELGWQMTPFDQAMADTWQEYQTLGWKA